MKKGDTDGQGGVEMDFGVTDEEEAILSGLHHYLYLKQEFKDAVRKYIFRTVSRLKQVGHH